MGSREHSHEGEVDLVGMPTVADGPHPLTMVDGGKGCSASDAAPASLTGWPWEASMSPGAPSLGPSAGPWVRSAVSLGLADDDVAGPDRPTARPNPL